MNEAEILHDEGMVEALAHTSNMYKEEAHGAILLLARRGGEFTVEDLRDLVGDPPNHPAAMGAIINGALRSKMIKSVGFAKAKRRSSHARYVRVFTGV
jgi:hypothetical protein